MQRAAARLGLIAAALLAAAPPPPAERKLEGIYQLDMRETASALRLEAGGRFQWAFSQGALDVATEGRWRREGDKIILTSEQPQESIFCCLANFSDLPLAILPAALEMEWQGEKLRYDALEQEQGR